MKKTLEKILKTIKRNKNILIGTFELTANYLLFSQIHNAYQGEAPIYVAIPYIALHIFIVTDSVSRIFLNSPCYKIKPPPLDQKQKI